MTASEIIYTVVSKAYDAGDFTSPVSLEMLLIALEMLENNNF